MNDYSFTVGIPFYIKSNPTDLKKAIDSINQTLTPNKIHLIQDGPINDNIQNILDKYLLHESKAYLFC